LVGEWYNYNVRNTKAKQKKIIHTIHGENSNHQPRGEYLSSPSNNPSTQFWENEGATYSGALTTVCIFETLCAAVVIDLVLTRDALAEVPAMPCEDSDVFSFLF